jgi:hypothetical protein
MDLNALMWLFGACRAGGRRRSLPSVVGGEEGVSMTPRSHKGDATLEGRRAGLGAAVGRSQTAAGVEAVFSLAAGGGGCSRRWPCEPPALG